MQSLKPSPGAYATRLAKEGRTPKKDAGDVCGVAGEYGWVGGSEWWREVGRLRDDDPIMGVRKVTR
jgi:hypothetical protein